MSYEALVWIVPVAVAVAGLWWPRAGLLVFIATLPLFSAPPGGPYLAALDVAAVVAIVTGMRGSRGRPSALDAGVTAFAVVALAAFFPLAYRPPSWEPGVLGSLLAFLPDVERWTILSTWREMANVLLGAGIYLAIKRAFGRGATVAPGRALGVGLLGALLLGYLELAGWIDLWEYRPIGRPYFDDRFHSVFFHSGWLAEFVVLATPLAIGAWGVGRSKRKLVAYALVVLAGGAVLLSGQRGAWFAALAQLGVTTFLLRHRFAGKRLISQLAIGAAVIGAIAVLVVGVSSSSPDVGLSLRGRLGEATSDLSHRTVIWKAALAMAAERPVLGWGSGSFSPVFDLEVMADQSTQVPGGSILGHHHTWLTAHNTYLMLLAERGVMGLASLIIVGVLLILLLRQAIDSDDERTRQIASGLLVSVTGFAVYGLVQYMFFPRVNGFLVWLVLGVAALVDQGLERPRLERAVRVFIACALVLLPLRAFFGEPAPARGSGTFGFHAPELGEGDLPFQWTSASTAMRSIRWEDEVLRLRVANGHPKAVERPVFVEVLVDGAVVKQVVADGGWEDVSVYLGPPARETIVLGLAVDRTFRPFSDYRKYSELEDSRDLRRLGIAVGEIRWERAVPPVHLKMPEGE